MWAVFTAKRGVSVVHALTPVMVWTRILFAPSFAASAHASLSTSGLSHHTDPMQCLA